jgi:hypothetical protein
MWFDTPKPGLLSTVLLDLVLSKLSSGRNHSDFNLDSESVLDVSSSGFEDLKVELDSVIASLSKFLFDKQFGGPESGMFMNLDISSFCFLFSILLRLVINDKNRNLLRLLLKLILLFADKRQQHKTVVNMKIVLESKLLKCSCIEPSGVIPGNTIASLLETRDVNDLCLGVGLKTIFAFISDTLPKLLPAKSGFSQHAIEFLYSKNLFFPYVGFNLKHLEILSNVAVVGEAFIVNHNNLAC